MIDLYWPFQVIAVLVLVAEKLLIISLAFSLLCLLLFLLVVVVLARRVMMSRRSGMCVSMALGCGIGAGMITAAFAALFAF